MNSRGNPSVRRGGRGVRGTKIVNKHVVHKATFPNLVFRRSPSMQSLCKGNAWKERLSEVVGPYLSDICVQIRPSAC